MKIHKEGLRIIWGIAVFLVLVNVAFLLLIAAAWLKLMFLFISVFFLVFVLRFFRKPARELEANSRYVYAPADGQIMVIEQTTEPEYLKDERIQVSIFMSVWNVHINWFPVKGVVKYYKYHPGKFLVARLPKSSTDNERTSVVVEEEKTKTPLMIRQIAGAVARRIVSYATPGKEVQQGEELGFIKFGSRVDVFLPLGSKIGIELGQEVRGNKTVIAELP